MPPSSASQRSMLALASVAKSYSLIIWRCLRPFDSVSCLTRSISSLFGSDTSSHCFAYARSSKQEWGPVFAGPILVKLV